MRTRLPATRIEPGDSTLRLRLVLAGGALLSVFSLLSWRIIHIQVESHEHFDALVDKKHRRIDVLEAHRGRIFDARGQLLAADEPVQRIIFDVGFLKERDALSDALKEAEGISAAEIRKAMTLEAMQQRYLDHVIPMLARHAGLTETEVRDKITAKMSAKMAGDVVIHKEMPVQSGIELRDELERSRLGNYQVLRARIGAVGFVDSFVRRYPATVPLAHLAGLTGLNADKDETVPRGISGLEKYFEQKLSGKPGQRVITVDGKGNELAAYRGEVTPPVHGANLKTTIDAGLQEIVLRELDTPSPKPDELSVAQMKPNRVIVVLFEPRTMALRAVASRDFTRPANAGPVLMNDLVEYVYEPGSTIKIATIAAALSNGKVGPATTLSIDPDGDRTYDDEDIEPIRDDHAFPSLTVEGIMVHSSNIGAYKLALASLCQRNSGGGFPKYGICKVFPGRHMVMPTR